jgi:ParB family chromosome partitioning protein
VSKRSSYRERITQTLQRASASTVTSDFTQLAGDLQEVDVSLIELRPQQPRRQFDNASLRHLEESIKAQGVVQPIVVHQKEGGGFDLVAGERRWRASKNAGLERIPARVITGHTDHQLDFIAAMENLQREDLNPVDEADAILKVLANELGADQAELPALLSRLRRVDRSRHNVMSKQDDLAGDLEIIKKVETVFSQLAAGNWQSFVANKMGVLKLSDDLLSAVRRGEVAYTKANALRRVKDAEARAELLNLAKDKSLEELRELVRQRIKQSPGEPHRLRTRLNDVARHKRLETLPDKKHKRALKLIEELERLLAETSP